MKFLKSLWYGVTSGVVLAMSIVACTSSPIKQAETFEQRAYALYGTYVVFQEMAVGLVQDTTTPERVKQGLRDADKAAYPLAESLVDAVTTVGDIRAIINMCSTLTLPDENPACTPDNERRLANAITNLGAIYFKAQPVIVNLTATVRGAK